MSTHLPNEAALEDLFNATQALADRLRLLAEEVHGQQELNAGKRSLLKSLSRNGPQTVAKMASAQRFSRQYVRSLTEQLSKEGFVAYEANPAHKRSRLVQLTPKGKKQAEAMEKREASALTGLDLGLTEADLRQAAEVVRTVRRFFESEDRTP
jgi:DNA-binding MarR family transcriptional regulator